MHENKEVENTLSSSMLYVKYTRHLIRSIYFLFIFSSFFRNQQNIQHMSRLVRKPTICICKNKGADQLHSNCEADQRLCFRYTDSTLPFLLKSEISSFWPDSVTVQPDLCQTCSETTLLVFPRGGLYVYYKYTSYTILIEKLSYFILSY